MEWLAAVALAVIADSGRIYADNYISDVYFNGRGAVSQKYFYGIAFLILGPVLGVISGLDFTVARGASYVLLILSGMFASLAGIPYYKALEQDDSTNLGIFIQIAPILYLVLGWLFLGETISLLQLVAFLVILAAPFLVIFTTRKRSRKTKIRAALYAFLYVLISVVGNLIFVKENAEELSFLNAMALIFFGKGLGNLLIIAVRPAWRRRFKEVVRTSKKSVMRPLIGSMIGGVTKDFAYRGALVLAPSVALASVTSDSAEPIVIFFMGIILTLIWPKFGRESLTRKSVAVHLLATILVVIGVILIQYSA